MVPLYAQISSATIHADKLPAAGKANVDKTYINYKEVHLPKSARLYPD